jgi:hypothetical protein
MLVHVSVTHCMGRPSGGVGHIGVGYGRTISNCPHISFLLLQNATCYTNSLVSWIHVNTTKLSNIMCTLVATCVILQSLECNPNLRGSVSCTRGPVSLQSGRVILCFLIHLALAFCLLSKKQNKNKSTV